MDRPSKSCPACCEEIARRAVRCPHCTSRQPDAPLMHRNIPGRVLGGICASLSLQLGLDAVLIRVAFVISLALSAGFTFWAYALLWVMTPYEADGQSPLAQAFDWAKGILGRVDATQGAAAAQAPVDSPDPA